jgi:two-component system, OmpR family, sensor histidine kinase KdpD
VKANDGAVFTPFLRRLDYSLGRDGVKRLRSRSAAIGAVGCTAVALFGILCGARVELAFASVLYLLLIIVIAWQARLRAAVIVAVWSTLCLDFFFTEPRHTLRFLSLADFWSVVAFASVALFISHLSNRIREQAEDLRLQQERQKAIYELSVAALSLDWSDRFGDHLAALVRSTIHASAVVIWTARDDRAFLCGAADVSVDSMRAAMRAGRNYDLPGSGTYIRLLKSGMREIGVLLVVAHDLAPLTADSLAPVVSFTLERARALSNEVSAQSEQLSEQLRTSVLDGLAHAFKTPLTTIALSSAGLSEVPDMPQEQRVALSRIIEAQAERLHEITQQVLRTARLDLSKVMSLRAVDLAQSMEEVIHGLGEEARSRIKVATSTRVPMDGDPSILKMAFEQILENALKYSDAGTQVEVNMRHEGDLTSIAIHNLGSFIEPAERERIFLRFYRSPRMAHRAAGTGIGLSVALRAIEAHGGHIIVQSDVKTGTTFRIDLPNRGDNP